jgi:hypothetical protein
MTMRLHPIPLIAAVIPWLLHLATRTLARALNLPEPMVYGTGVFVLARVQAAENSIGRTLCPFRLLRRFQNLLRAWRQRATR